MSPARVLLLSVLALGCSSSDADKSDAVVACSGTRLPQTGDRCDPSQPGAEAMGYCRLESCAYQCLDECKCKSGRWSCEKSCRDNYGCGSAPVCSDQCTTPFCASVASSCPGTCNPLTAQRIDPARKCLASSQTVGCAAPTTGCTGALTCLVRTSDNVAFWWGGDCHLSGWRACTEAEKAGTNWDSPACDADAGTDAPASG